jgi:hypothetical protein
VKEKVEPRPGADSTQIFPPCSSTIRFEIASPRPVPPFLRVIALSIRRRAGATGQMHQPGGLGDERSLP